MRELETRIDGEGDTVRKNEVKPRAGAALPEGGKANRSIYDAPGSAEGSGAHPKCLYTNTHSMREKWDKLEALVLSQSYDIIGGISPMTAVLGRRAISYSGDIDRTGKVEPLCCM